MDTKVSPLDPKATEKVFSRKRAIHVIESWRQRGKMDKQTLLPHSSILFTLGRLKTLDYLGFREGQSNKLFARLHCQGGRGKERVRVITEIP